MIYRIVCSGQDIYSDTLETSVISPSLELELNSAGTLSFTLPPEHENWFLLNVFTDEVDVYENNKIIWFGRPLQITRDWKNQKRVTCEGALAYFNDSIQRPLEYNESKTALYEDAEAYPGCVGFFNDIIETHNRQVPVNRQILIGNITVDNCNVYRNVDYTTTSDCLQQMCLDSNGGYFVLRKEYDEESNEWIRYIDWLKDLSGATDQPAQFGLNMLDLSQDLNGADICTVLIPTGADDSLISSQPTYDDDNLCPYNQEGHTFHHVEGSDELVHKESYEKYGRVLKQKDWSDYRDIELMREACEWMIRQNTDIPTIECSAADLHYLDEYSDYIPFKVGQQVQVNSEPHGISMSLPIYKISMQLDSGIKKMTIGTPPKRELSDIVKSGGGSTRSSSGSSSSGGSSGGGSTSIPVKDVRVKKQGDKSYKSVVKKKIAEIDLSELGGGDVVDVKVNGTSVLDSDKVAQVSVPVTDVQVDGTSVVDSNKVAQFNSSDFGTPIEANPSEEATDDLESVKIGETVYDLAGGTEVIPNPETFTDTLETLQIGDTSYKLPGVGLGMPYMCDLLFHNDPIPSSRSGTANVRKTYELLNSIDEYDAVIVYGYLFNKNRSYDQASAQIIFKKDYNVPTIGDDSWPFLINGSIGTTIRRLAYEFDDSTHITTIANRSVSYEEPILYKVYGLRFKATVFQPQIYSLEERWIGTWVDGKKVYQKTIKTMLPSYDTGLITTIDLPIERVIFLSWNIINSNNDVVVGSATYYNINIYLDIDTGDLNVQHQESWTMNREIYITLQYTKTTDSPWSSYYLPGGVICQEYSLEEKIVARWADGRPVYQKTFYMESLEKSSSGAKVYLNDISNVDRILSKEMTGKRYDSTSKSTIIHFDDSIIPEWMEGSNALYFLGIEDGGKVYIEYYNGYYTDIKDIYVTLQYTKTTDDPSTATAPTILATQAELEALAEHFQDGVDSIYDACVSKGSTPASHSLADVVAAIEAI